MSTDLVIEILDAGLVVAAESGRGVRAVSESPGYALLDHHRVQTGSEALRRARLRPRFVHNRFWQELGSNVLGRPFPRHWTTADLAHAHLEATWLASARAADPALVAVSSVFTEQQLGLLMGIAGAAGIRVAGLIDAAVAAAAQIAAAERVLHLDLHLHRLVGTEVAISDEVRRRRVEVLPEVGLAQFDDLWARRIADETIRTTRFDPLHAGDTEQWLYDRLAGWLTEAGDSGAVEIRFESGAREHAIEISLDQWAAAAESQYSAIHNLVRRLSGPGPVPTIALSERLARLPGLAERLADSGEIVVLDRLAASRGALAAAQWIEPPGETVRFVTRLPHRAAPLDSATSRTETSEPDPPATSPTHLVFEGRAYRVGEQPLLLGDPMPPGRRGLPLTRMESDPPYRCSLSRVNGKIVVEGGRSGVLLNDEPLVGGAVLSAGDRLQLGGEESEMTLVTVVDDDGQT